MRLAKNLLCFVLGLLFGFWLAPDVLHPSVFWLDHGLEIRWVDTTPGDVWFVIDESRPTRGIKGYRIVRVYHPGLFGRGGWFAREWNGRKYPIYSDDPPLPEMLKDALPPKIYSGWSQQQLNLHQRTTRALEIIKKKYKIQSHWPHVFFLPEELTK